MPTSVLDGFLSYPSEPLACNGFAGLKDGLRRVELNDDVVDAVLEGGQHRDAVSNGDLAKSREETFFVRSALFALDWTAAQGRRGLIIQCGDKGHDDAEDKQR